MDDFHEVQAEDGFVWVECFGGPGDGDTVPTDAEDPLPTFPYLSGQELYWYELRIRAEDSTMRYFPKGMVEWADWTPAWSREEEE